MCNIELCGSLGLPPDIFSQVAEHPSHEQIPEAVRHHHKEPQTLEVPGSPD